MSIDISRVARAIRDQHLSSLSPLKLSHAQECVAAALGFKSLAACQTAAKLAADVVDNSRFIVLDVQSLHERAQEFHVVDSSAELASMVKSAIERVHPETRVFLTSEPRLRSVDRVLSELLGLPPFLADGLDEVRYSIVENGRHEVQGFIFNFDEDEWAEHQDAIRARHGRLEVYAPVSLLACLMSGERPLKRHYVHGDRHEEQDSLFYCRACDFFVPFVHFEDEHPGLNGKRYFSDLLAWDRQLARYRLSMRRPHNAVNTVALRAETERGAYEASRSPFHKWIVEQVDRTDWFGELAQDIRGDARFPFTSSSKSDLRAYIEGRSQGGAALDAFDDAWANFSAWQVSEVQ